MVKSHSELQKAILEFLNQKRAAVIGDITTYVEEYSSYEPGKVQVKYSVTRSIKNLAKRGDVLLYETESSSFAKLTSQGRNKLRSLRLSENTHLMPVGWDGKWRIVILDIPEKDKEKRNALRYILKKAHFVCLKNSVWISPYPFEHMLENMKDDLELTDELMVIVTNSLDTTTELQFRKQYWQVEDTREDNDEW